MLQTGIGVYTRNLIRELHDAYGWPIHALTFRDQRAQLAPYCERITTVDAPIYTLREQWTITWAARRDKVLHVPHYNAPLLYRGELLVTIHDLTHVLDRTYRNSWKARLYAAPMLAAGARRAAHVFTVSEYSKARIVEHLGIEASKISVVYNGVDRAFFEGETEQSRKAVAERFGIASPYLLYVGNLKPHKNVDTLLEAYAHLFKGRERDCALVLAGKDRLGEVHLSEHASRLGITPTFIADANTHEVADLYRSAEALVQPSFEEGFGLPVIEAMACGTPVACSSAASLPEVAGDAALFFDPHDVRQLASAIETMLTSSALRASLREKGLARAARFTWADTARRHVEIYRRFCD